MVKVHDAINDLQEEVRYRPQKVPSLD